MKSCDDCGMLAAKLYLDGDGSVCKFCARRGSGE